jgi:hypothetical protein
LQYGEDTEEVLVEAPLLEQQLKFVRENCDSLAKGGCFDARSPTCKCGNLREETGAHFMFVQFFDVS